MRQVFFFLLVLLVSAGLQAQQAYFMVIDADNNQPFSVMVGTKKYKSSTGGHLIIPNLIDSTYKLAVNFPLNVYPEQVFTVSINKKDKGYQLKKTTENSWGLYDWRTMELIKAKNIESGTTGKEVNTPEISKDAFARMMASVVNDSAVLFFAAAKPVVAKKNTGTEPPKQTNTDKPAQIEVVDKKTAITDSQSVVINVAPQKQPDSSDNALKPSGIKSIGYTKPVDTAKKETIKSPAFTQVEKKDNNLEKTMGNKNKTDVDSLLQKEKKIDNKIVSEPSVAGNEAKKSVIKKISDRQTNELREIIFTDSNNALAPDTISIVMRFDETLALEKRTVPDTIAEKTDMRATKNLANDSPIVQSRFPVENNKVDTLIARKPVTEATDSLATKKEGVPAAEKKLPIINSDCRNFASDLDVDKLRIKMLSESNLDERIVLAKKVFKTKCFTTKQVKGLTELFVNDKTRYMFFDAAYPFVSDSENFKGLVELLTEEYFITRFKAMVRM